MKWVYADRIQNATCYWCPACAPHSNAKIPAECIDGHEEIRCDMCNSQFLKNDEAYQAAQDKDSIPRALRLAMERKAIKARIKESERRLEEIVNQRYS